MKCTISNWACPYHACMSNDCQRSEVLQHHPGFGAGLCKKSTTPDNGIKHSGGNSFPAFLKEGSVLDSAVAVVVLTSIRNQETSIQP